MNSKPPIGITPRWLLDEERAIEIEEAIRRYNEADYPIPIEWIQELNEVYERLNKFYHIFDTCTDAIHWGNSVREREW